MECGCYRPPVTPHPLLSRLTSGARSSAARCSHRQEEESSKHLTIGQHFSPPEELHSPFYPLLGPYSSADAATLATHFRWLKGAGVGVVAVSWWGPTWRKGTHDTQNVTTDDRLPLLLQVAEAQGMSGVSLGAVCGWVVQLAACAWLAMLPSGSLPPASTALSRSPAPLCPLVLAPRRAQRGHAARGSHVLGPTSRRLSGSAAN